MHFYFTTFVAMLSVASSVLAAPKSELIKNDDTVMSPNAAIIVGAVTDVDETLNFLTASLGK
jgi:hypothetical protein